MAGSEGGVGCKKATLLPHMMISEKMICFWVLPDIFPKPSANKEFSSMGLRGQDRQPMLSFEAIVCNVLSEDAIFFFGLGQRGTAS